MTSGQIYAKSFWDVFARCPQCGLIVWTGESAGGKVGRNYMLFCFHTDGGWSKFVSIY